MIWEIDERARTIDGLDEDGRPKPEYAAALGLIAAPYGRRVLATLIEAVVLVLLQLPLLLVALPALLAVAAADDPAAALGRRDDLVLVIVCAAASWLLSTAFIMVQLILHGRRGVTLGKALVGIRSVNVRTLERPGFWRGAVVRYLVLSGSQIVPLLGPVLVVALSPLFDPARRRRGWADLAAATWFVDVRAGLHPYDAKRMRIARKTVATDLRDERAELPSLATAGVRTESGAYIPLARSKGGVLGAVRSSPSAASAPIGFDPDAPAAVDVPVIPTTVAPRPAAEPAVELARTGTPAWTPPPLIADTSEPASAVEPARTPAPAHTPRPAPPAEPSTQPTPEPTPDPPRAAQIVLTLDAGEDIAVPGGGVLLGRAPATAPGDVDLTPVPVADPSRSISKTHWALLRRDGGLVAVERGSTNGSVRVRGAEERPLTPGEPIDVASGDTIRFGDRSAVIGIR